ncbi:heat shock factor-binding protein 1-like [Panonychus citri]|uniref:heat shock factor-binding protein 1-like n=1 Tax=Panonychus citri TaxID=50023 RepID=UPI002307668C|nr:heat shock factor-binding protein 1-like [Panonychus citri]
MDSGSAQNQPKGEHNVVGAQPDIKDVGDVANFVQTLLQQVQDKFQVMSEQILNRIDEMGHRIDDLEQNLNEVIQQAGITDEVLTGSTNTQLTKSNSMPADKSSLSKS